MVVATPTVIMENNTVFYEFDEMQVSKNSDRTTRAPSTTIMGKKNYKRNNIVFIKYRSVCRECRKIKADFV